MLSANQYISLLGGVCVDVKMWGINEILKNNLINRKLNFN